MSLEQSTAPNSGRDRIARIRELNDNLRCNNQGGRVIFSEGVTALGAGYAERVRRAVAEFDAFDEFEGPDSEHDIGYAEVEGISFYWIINCHDLSLELPSEDPSDPAKTIRSLFIVRSEGV